jgi:hypothetical protein
MELDVVAVAASRDAREGAFAIEQKIGPSCEDVNDPQNPCPHIIGDWLDHPADMKSKQNIIDQIQSVQFSSSRDDFIVIPIQKRDKRFSSNHPVLQSGIRYEGLNMNGNWNSSIFIDCPGRQVLIFSEFITFYRLSRRHFHFQGWNRSLLAFDQYHVFERLLFWLECPDEPHNPTLNPLRPV